MMLYPMLGQAEMGNALKRASFPRLNITNEAIPEIPFPGSLLRTYLKIIRENSSANTRSNPPRKNPAAMANTMTTTVNRAVSSRLGQTDFRSSE
tara:strand:- start:1707 stop:1988 length:282 start_codon:yes stop_codon:yes gene_type:complete